jgi:hypothetical protein
MTTTTQTEITGDALTEQRPLMLKIGRTASSATSLADASAQYRKYIDDNGFGARDAVKATVKEVGGKVLASISYNGRVWEA